ncbi:MAG: hypothetical protein ACM3RX_07475, partial [Methanococcaceae archaeon]
MQYTRCSSSIAMLRPSGGGLLTHLDQPELSSVPGPARQQGLEISESFNPYFKRSCSRITIATDKISLSICVNSCFKGS